MGDMIIGLVIVVTGILSGIYGGVQWWTVAHVAAGFGLFAYGLRKAEENKET